MINAQTADIGLEGGRKARSNKSDWGIRYSDECRNNTLTGEKEKVRGGGGVSLLTNPQQCFVLVAHF